MKMKRKRKNACPSPLLDDSPKRTKVHAQRKFAQGSNVNSPVITPIRELESESPEAVLPEPVELLPIKRPNTEDFLTFLCFRGTPILPTNLNFFNTASIVDTNGQVHEIKSESSPKNGPIDIAKCGSSSEKPFVAFGVRKRADPIVISRQMDRKRRHALALQCLRRKYQEQKMAKIRALTISKLSEKVTNKTLVRTNTVSKTETITKKTNTGALQKTKVVATKHIKVTTRTLKTTMRPKLKIKQNMCLRSFRGRFIQQELPFRKRVVLPNKPIGRSSPERKMQRKKMEETDKSSQPSTSRQPKPMVKKVIPASNPVGRRSTRSNLINTKSEIRRKKIKRILIPNSHTIIKPKQRSLRLTTLKKSVISHKKKRPVKTKQNVRKSPQETLIENTKKRETKTEQKKTTTNKKGELQKTETRCLRETVNQSMESKETNKGKDIVKDYRKVTDLKEVSKTIDRNRRHLTRSLDNRKEVNISTDIKRRNNIAVAIKKSRISNVIQKKFSTKNPPNTKKAANNSDGAEETNKRITRQSDSTKGGNTKKEAPAEDDKTGDKRKSTGKKNKPKFTDKSEESDNETDRNKTDAKKTKGKHVKNADKDDENSSDTDTTDKESGSTKKLKKTKQIVDEKEPAKAVEEKTKASLNKNEKPSKNSPNDEPNVLETEKLPLKEDNPKKEKQTKQKLDKLIADKCKQVANKNKNLEKVSDRDNEIDTGTVKKPKQVKKIETETIKTIDDIMDKPVSDIETAQITSKAKQTKHKADTGSKSKISKNENAKMKDENIKVIKESSEKKIEKIVSKKVPVEFKTTINTDDNETGIEDNNTIEIVEKTKSIILLEEPSVSEVILNKPKKKDDKEVILILTDHDESKTEDVLKKSKRQEDKEVIVNDHDECKNEDAIKKSKRKDEKEHTVGTNNDENQKEEVLKKVQNEEELTINEQDESKNKVILKKFKRKDDRESTMNDHNESKKEEVSKKAKRKDIKETTATDPDDSQKSKKKDHKESAVNDQDESKHEEVSKKANRRDIKESTATDHDDSKNSKRKDDNESTVNDQDESKHEEVSKKIKRKDIKESIATDHDDNKKSKRKDDKESTVNDQDESKYEEVSKKTKRKDINESTATDHDENKKSKRKDDKESTVNDQDEEVSKKTKRKDIRESIATDHDDNKKSKRKDDNESTVNDQDESKHEEVSKKIKRKDIKESIATDHDDNKKSKRKDDKESTVNDQDESKHEEVSKKTKRKDIRESTATDHDDNKKSKRKDDKESTVNDQDESKHEEVLKKTKRKDIKESTATDHDDNKKSKWKDDQESTVNDQDESKYEEVSKKTKRKDIKESTATDHDDNKKSKRKDDQESTVNDQDESKYEEVSKKTKRKDIKESTATDHDENKKSKRKDDKESTVNDQDEEVSKRTKRKDIKESIASDYDDNKKSKRKDDKELTVNDQDESKHEEVTKKMKRKDNKESTATDRDDSMTSKRKDNKELSITEDEIILKKYKRKDDSKDSNKLVSEKEEAVAKSQRPSRKSKEAAAIYMEILSHKLVNDSIGDDDNISIDSFPELPNVKRTEQRENELKAKAKTSKDDKDIEDNYEETVTELSEVCNKKAKKAKDIETIAACSEIIDITDSVDDSKKSSDNPKNVGKGKSVNDNPIEVEVAKSKLRKSDTTKSPEIIETEDKPKRLMRHSAQITQTEENDSDESFHIDVKVPRKKKNTRSRVATRVTKGVKTFNLSLSDSENSTTSDVNIHSETSNKKIKKFSKTKSMKKADTNYSDSDDEPLSKRTIKTVDSGQKSSIKVDKTSTKDAVKKSEPIPTRTETKPKRECAKLPQNYLPMLSSSDEDEIFHGFAEKVEPKPKTFEVACNHAPPLLDLLNKDLGRRFGKEKVNMSNEQIEKWLKDSALAGSSIKKENDEMLKFGERIPTETNLEISDNIDTEKLKESLLGEQKEQPKDVKTEDTSTVLAKIEVTPKSGDATKPAVDRKLIFRKSKSESVPTPNVSAFSPENESSVYAFGEENEETISTPFRRPSRRPSSTATSKSEDESSKVDDSSRTGQFRKPTTKQITKEEPEPVPNPPETEDSTQFYIPQQPTKSSVLKSQNKSLFKSKSSEKLPDIDEFKYKIPSSPSASSSSSAKLYKRQTQKQKNKSLDFMTPSYVSDFPKNNEPSRLVEAPVFHPTEQEFQDPLEYIERIRHKAEQFGICKIVPPSSFKPECKVTDDMRFTAYNQYVNKMLYRWGPNFKEFMAIKKYLETQSISLSHPPWIGGMEIDLPRLYQTVQLLGGLKEVIEKKKWSKVSELMKIPKSAQDRVTKLDDIYCKYLLPYDTLSPAEREKLFDEVETEWAKKESRNLVKSQEDKQDEADSEIDEGSEECITKGRNVALNAFYRIARNTMSMYFKTNEPTPQEVEQEYWKYVVLRENHICVHSGSIDCGNWGYGFPVTKNSPFAKHPWNLKILTNNTGSILRSLGPMMGVTVPTLHFGMVFSACCWYRDPHGLPWIEYLHTGGTKIWYGVPNSMGDQFHAALKTLVPNYCKNKELWLPSDTIMVPPNLLVENNVSLCHSVQEPGQFIVVFPKAFTSSISTGYVVSESVFFAPTYWLKTARALFDGLRRSNEPAMFSLDRLLMSVVNDGKCNVEIVRQTLPLIQDLCGGELSRRERLAKMGEVVKEKLPIPEVAKGKKKKFQQGDEGDYECEICRCSLFLSMMFDTVEGITYCLDHANEMMEKKELELGNCKFMYTYDDEELKSLPERVKILLDTRLQKKVPNKFAGMPTLLGRN